jgi:hypothetical protein
MDAVVKSAAGFGILVIVYLVFLVGLIIATAKIISKAGYSPWFVLLAFIPIVNIVMFLVFAFSDWPVDQELRRYREGGYGPGGYGPGPGGYGGPGPGGYPPPWPGQSSPGYGGADPPSSPPGWPPPPPGGYPPPPAPGG